MCSTLALLVCAARVFLVCLEKSLTWISIYAGDQNQRSNDPNVTPADRS